MEILFKGKNTYLLLMLTGCDFVCHLENLKFVFMRIQITP